MEWKDRASLISVLIISIVDFFKTNILPMLG